jgi:hypothetical protein
MKLRPILIILLAFLAGLSIGAQEVKLAKLSSLLAKELTNPVSPAKAFAVISVLPACCEPSVDGSEVSVDGFYEAYANAMAAVSDQKHKTVKHYRRALQQAFLELFSAECVIGGPGTYQIHERARLPAKLEWVMFKAEESGFNISDRSVLPLELSDLWRSCQANIEAEEVPANRKELETHYLRALQGFKSAFSEMSPPAKQYFLYQAVYFLKHAGNLDAST